MQRVFSNVLSKDLEVSRAFYVDLFGWKIAFHSDWFIHLQAPDNPGLELGLLKRDHGIVPDAYRRPPQGMLLTVVVDDVDALFERAQSLGHEVLEAPRNLFYGQRRMLLQDPDGTLVDVSSECPPDPAWLASLGASGSS